MADRGPQQMTSIGRLGRQWGQFLLPTALVALFAAGVQLAYESRVGEFFALLVAVPTFGALSLAATTVWLLNERARRRRAALKTQHPPLLASIVRRYVLVSWLYCQLPLCLVALLAGFAANFSLVSSDGSPPVNIATFGFIYGLGSLVYIVLVGLPMVGFARQQRRREVEVAPGSLPIAKCDRLRSA